MAFNREKEGRSPAKDPRCFEEQIQREKKGRKKRSRYESDSSEHSSNSNSSSEKEDKFSTASAREKKSKKRRRRSSSSDSSSTIYDSTNSSDDDSSSSSSTSSSGEEVVAAKRRETEKRREKKKALKKLKKKYRRKKVGAGAAENEKKKEKRKESSREDAARSRKAAKKKKKKKKKNAVGDGDFYSGASVTTQYGKYGLLQESDLWKKRPEFSLWLMEVKGKHLEELHNWEEKELFKTYMEDYNTATLPSKKYYNLEVYEARQRLKKKNVQGHRELTDFNDEARRKDEIKALREQQRVAEAEEQLRAMRNDRSKVADMREQLMLKSRVETLYRLGHNAEAKKLAEILQPE